MKRGIASGTIHDLRRLIRLQDRQMRLTAVKKEMFELYMDMEKALQDWHPERAHKKSSNKIIA